ncbi:putative ammonium transporter 1 [Anneissia japonica]|uniref:putative ammonium transporter 1 n=1 Tax=Anneissia japonica TaxID=1529436 RepID=UPI0014257445|nr:putative ammonium transporter 1 [Anneissia japonica]
MPSEEVDDWFFQFVFAATAATIVSGSMAERTEFVAYLVYSVFLTGFIYPIVTHWAWSSDGWLREMPNHKHISFIDFAGSSVVHILGGTVALLGAIMLGPRIGRFDADGNPVTIRGHTVPLAALGGFILFLGFLGFNGGSLGSISNPGDGVIVAESIVNTVLSGGVSALCALFINLVYYKGSLWSLLTAINGGLTGMVAICAGCDAVHRWGAFVIGLVSGFVVILVSKLVLRLRIDDPLDAVAVHLGGGFWGTIAVTILARDTGIVYAWNSDAFLSLLWNFTGAIAIFAWSAATSFIMFGSMKAFNILRVNPTIEEKGLDIAKHGEPAYPLTAYGHGWDMDENSETRVGLHFSMKSIFTVCTSRDQSIDDSEKAPSTSKVRRNTIPNHILEEAIGGKIDGLNSLSKDFESHPSISTVDTLPAEHRLDVSEPDDNGVKIPLEDVDKDKNALTPTEEINSDRKQLEEQGGSKVNYGFDKETNSIIESV